MISILLDKFKKPFAKYTLIGAPAWFIYEEVKNFYKKQPAGEAI